MDAARRAGMNAAQNATITVVTTTTANAVGPVGVTPCSTLRIQRPPPSHRHPNRQAEYREGQRLTQHLSQAPRVKPMEPEPKHTTRESAI